MFFRDLAKMPGFQPGSHRILVVHLIVGLAAIKLHEFIRKMGTTVTKDLKVIITYKYKIVNTQQKII